MKLADYLSANGISQSKFAELIGITQPTVSDLCAGKHSPRMETAERIMRATRGQVTANDFTKFAQVE